MEITVNVKIGITDDLKSFIKEVSGFAPESKHETATKQQPFGEIAKALDDQEKAEKKVKKLKPVETEPASPGVTIEDVRKVMQPIVDAGKRPQVKEILTSLGAINLPALAVDQYGAFIDKLKKLA